ncbi:MAG TPA: hypothetical protein VFV78_05590 [Vicinamibacterales bacterium]|nr:hypothetical protein [Vicinamibacterales bacterium]
MPTASSNVRGPLKSMLAGACAAVGLYTAMKLVRVFDVPLGPYVKSALNMGLFAAGGVAAGRAAVAGGRTLRSGTIAFGALLLGVAFGVVFWNALEDHVFSRVAAGLYEERRLFPVDVILLWMFGWLPLLAGLVAGMFIPWSRNGKQQP